MTDQSTLDEVYYSTSDHCGVSPSEPQGSINYQEKYAPLYEKVAQEKLQGREPNRYGYWPTGY